MVGEGSAARILVVGSVNVDLLVKVDRLPVRGETVAARDLEQQLGGKGANQAVAAAQLGARVALYGCVGADAWGERAREHLQRAGVETAWVRAVAGVPTGLAVITVDAEGHNTIAVLAGANGALLAEPPAEVEAALGCLAAVVVQFEVPSAALQGLYGRMARQRGRGSQPWLVVNPSPCRPEALPPPGLADLLVVNEVEAAVLTGLAADDPASAAVAARRLAEDLRPGGAAVVTLGAQGAVAWGPAWLGDAREPAGCWHVGALPVQAVDSTGAGDVFTGALAARLAAGQAVPEALRFAVAAAGLCVTRYGVQDAIPTREQAEQALPDVPGTVLLNQAGTVFREKG